MKNKIPIIAATLLLLSSCGNKVLIDESHSFKNNCWLRFEPETFSFEVNNPDKNHCLSLTLKYDTSVLTANALPLVVDFFRDSNEMHNFTPTMRLLNSDGTRRGQTIGQFCTVTDTIDQRRTYNGKGIYTYRIKQRTSKYEIYGINGLTFTVTAK